MKVYLLAAPSGPLRVWEEPKEGVSYVIGVDVAEGRAATTGNEETLTNRDWSVATVLDVETAAMLAQFRIQIDTHSLSGDLDMLGQFYNTAMLAVESNNMGMGVIQMLRSAAYPNLYSPQRMSYHAGNYFLGNHLWGWNTNRQTKPIMFAAIHEALAMGHRIPCKSLLTEMRGLEFDERGDIRHPPGKHDDQVMSYGIALCVRNDLFQRGWSRGAKVETLIPADSRKMWRLVREEERRLSKQRKDDEEVLNVWF